MKKFGKTCFEDNIQIALVAVWEALDKFDPQADNANVELWCITAASNALRAYIRRDNKFSYKDYEKLTLIQRVIERLFPNVDQDSNNSVCYDLVAQEAGLPVEEITYIINHPFRIGRINLDFRNSTEDGEGDTVGESIPDNSLRNDYKYLVDNLLSRLSPEEREILELTYFDGYELKEVALLHKERYGKTITVQGIQWKRDKVLKKLRSIICGEAGKSYDGTSKSCREILGTVL
jgi:RNA polymerase sigma factor (sigma-70 family)